MHAAPATPHTTTTVVARGSMAGMGFRDGAKLLDKRKTFRDGVDMLQRLVEGYGGGDAEAFMYAVRRAYTVLLSRYDDTDTWEIVTHLVATAKEKAMMHHPTDGFEKIEEWHQHLLSAAPGRTAPSDQDSQQQQQQQPQQQQNEGEGGGAQPQTPFPDIQALLSQHSQIGDVLNLIFSQAAPPVRSAEKYARHELLLVTIPHNAKEGEYTCCVCMEAFPPRAKAKKMPCEHIFHETCLIEWLKSNVTCPLCRYELPVTEPPQINTPGPTPPLSDMYS
eukprot:Sspe_Gene.25001::Locus_9991_Transcript_1_1_Confidence_1.000_Length_1272::g.25001::m.25001